MSEHKITLHRSGNVNHMELKQDETAQQGAQVKAGVATTHHPRNDSGSVTQNVSTSISSAPHLSIFMSDALIHRQKN